MSFEVERLCKLGQRHRAGDAPWQMYLKLEAAAHAV